MMFWVLGLDRHYLNGTDEVHYFIKHWGIFVEVCGKPHEARRFKTRKEADQFRKEYGLGGYTARKVECE